MQELEKSNNNLSEPQDPQKNKAETRRSFAVIGGILGVIILVVYLITAAYPSRLFSEVKDNDPADQQPVPAVVHPVLPASPLKSSSEALLTSTNEVWVKLFKKAGIKYAAPSLQFFEDTISAYECGVTLPATGSFYCPADKEIYLDLSFFNLIKKSFPGSADMVQAYIIAHQQGHHIESLLGITAKVEAARARLSDIEYQKLNNKEEMLADYYAGVWAHYYWKNGLDNSDATTAISAVTQVSALLAKNDENVVPDAYNYSNIGERANWFYKGYQSGDLKGGDSILSAKDLQ